MALNKKYLKADLCVVGGGLAGINTAITAARLGVKVVLVQERPVFGGNASGEIRMWVCGAGNLDLAYRETGLSEEINLENFYYNPTKNYNLWNAVLYNKVHSESNITSLMNCTCFDAKSADGVIRSVTAYQMTTQTLYEIEADYFADCSGDSILAPLTGADFAYGREAQNEYGEPMQTHTERDGKTMGNSCLLQARKVNKKIPFRAPEWAEKVSVEKLKSKDVNLYKPGENFWYIELGGELDVVADAESINKRLLALCLGVWDTIKNSGEFDADYFDLEFLGFLGAKRESRRMLGEYVLTANDIMDARAFPDTVAYGGWPLDDHNPKGFDGEQSNYMIQLHKPYTIPYRCLYSRNIRNLFFAGRNISATHMAMSSARVMGTCSVLGQAVGTAVWIAKKYAISPREVGERMDELQQTLLKADCYLPSVVRRVDALCKGAEIIGGDEVLRNGQDRAIDGESNLAFIKNGQSVTYKLEKSALVKEIKIVFDSDLKRESYDVCYMEKRASMRSNILDESPIMDMPKTLAKVFKVIATLKNGEQKIVIDERENKKRNILIPVAEDVQAISLTVLENWGGTDETGLFTFEFYA